MPSPKEKQIAYRDYCSEGKPGSVRIHLGEKFIVERYCRDRKPRKSSWEVSDLPPGRFVGLGHPTGIIVCRATGDGEWVNIGDLTATEIASGSEKYFCADSVASLLGRNPA